MWIKRTSVISGITRSKNIPVDPNDMLMWESGIASIQDSMPYLNDVDREFILSGIADDEWKDIFFTELEST